MRPWRCATHWRLLTQQECTRPQTGVIQSQNTLCKQWPGPGWMHERKLVPQIVARVKNGRTALSRHPKAWKWRTWLAHLLGPEKSFLRRKVVQKKLSRATGFRPQEKGRACSWTAPGRGSRTERRCLRAAGRAAALWPKERVLQHPARTAHKAAGCAACDAHGQPRRCRCANFRRASQRSIQSSCWQFHCATGFALSPRSCLRRWRWSPRGWRWRKSVLRCHGFPLKCCERW